MIHRFVDLLDEEKSPPYVILETDGDYMVWQVLAGIPTLITPTDVGQDERRNPELSPDRTQVTYEQMNASGFLEIRVCNIDGSGETVLDTSATTFMQWPAWKPDGSMIIYTISDVGSSAGGDVYEIAPNGTGKTLLHSPATDYCARRPIYSHDGSKIAFIRHDDGFGTPVPGIQLWVMNADGSSAASIKTLTNNQHNQCQFSWANTQNVLAYHPGGTFAGIRKINADGTGDTLLAIDTDTLNSHSISDKAWSPTDDRVFFGVLDSSAFGTGYYVFEALADGSDENRIFPSHSSHPLLRNVAHQRSPVQFEGRLYIFPTSGDRLSSINLAGGDYRIEHEIDAAPYNVGTSFFQETGFDFL